MDSDENSKQSRMLEEAALARLWLIGLGGELDEIPAPLETRLLSLADRYAASRGMTRANGRLAAPVDH